MCDGPHFEPEKGGDATFAISISDVGLLHDVSENRLRQCQIISIASPQNVCHIRIQITVDISSQIVIQVKVLDLSPWSEQEFGSWIRTNAEGGSLISIGKAIGQYWIACLKRIQCWNNIAREFSDLILHQGDLGRLSLCDLGHDHAILPLYLGQQEFSLSHHNVTLHIIWRISINGDGEVSNVLSARPRFPDRWGHIEVASELDKVGAAFNLLIKQKGINEAISLISRLMFPS